ncbi:MAG: 2-amino-4-hydroxy-6-hydroxymethyldihydropteridine diphosphokinase [Planctomycetes bacterium]|nr:2-amino-4-hydroxy-6-hydroxymethyldihydropteridine diphosphokinase [Planctomycetota bacterium]
MTEAFLALGANLGDRASQLRRSLMQLEERGVRVWQLSRFHRTVPVGGPVDQPEYLNAVARVESPVAPHRLLQHCLEVEFELGRERRTRNGPRSCDLDLLWFGGCKMVSKALTLPHPRFAQRHFVLEPWVEVASRLVVEGRSVSAHLAALD